MFLSGQQIEVYRNGEVTDNIRFCVGQNVTFVCTIPDSVYQWVVDSPYLNDENGFIALNNSITFKRGPFILSAEDSALGRISSLNVVVFETLGTSIGCLGLESGRQQSIFIDVVGKYLHLEHNTDKHTQYILKPYTVEYLNNGYFGNNINSSSLSPV